MNFEVVLKDAFLKDFVSVPQSTQKGVTRSLNRLKEDPFRTANVKRVMKRQYQNVYRVRIGDYRLIYAVGDRIISLLAIGPRSSIYNRYLGDTEVVITGQEVQAAAPQAQVRTYTTTPYDGTQLFYPDGSDEAVIEGGDRNVGETPHDFEKGAGGVFAELLERWNIPLEERSLILGCQNLEEIFQLDLPEKTMNVVQHWYHPPTLRQLEEQPDYSLDAVTDLDRFRDGTLTRFLLKLSPEQERVAARSLKGPALVKGGPGTGKSLVALYRVKNLVDPSQYKLFEPLPRVLFLTYGKSLMNASQQLLEELIPNDLDHVEVTNVDVLVRKIVIESGERWSPISQLGEFVEQAQLHVLTTYQDSAASGWFTLADLRPNYLVEEIGWVIEGQRIRSLEQYLEIDRTGRGVSFSQSLRKLVWEVYEETLKLSADKGYSWEYYRGLALDALQEQKVAVAKYDVVIVDEAQDLSPVSLALCAELCKAPQGLFFTADANQSIYNRGFSWNRIHDFLNFRGRSTILHYNYRSTEQIAIACKDFLGAAETDNETVVAHCVHQGPKPTVFLVSSTRKQYATLAKFLKQSAEELRLPVWTGTVLTLSNRQATEVANALNELGLAAKHVKGEELHLREKVVKVMTLHTSKGLEFPTVAIAHVEKDSFPGIKENLIDQGEIQEFEDCKRKLLFVGCSRAMRRLALFANRADASPFLEDLSSGRWERVTK